MTAKLILTNGSFEVYKIGAVLVINENGEFAYNLRKTDAGYHNIEKRIADTIANRAELAQEAADEKAARRAAALARLSAYVARNSEQVAFDF